MNARMVEVMARRLGEVVHYPKDSSECRGKFVRVRVRVDITKPLQRVVKMKFGDREEPSLIFLKYERLPEFCHICGRIGHCSWDCSDEEAKVAAKSQSRQGYGSWLKASSNEKAKTKMDRAGAGDSKKSSRAIHVGTRDTPKKTTEEYAQKVQPENIAEHSLVEVEVPESCNKEASKDKEVMVLGNLTEVVPAIGMGENSIEGQVNIHTETTMKGVLLSTEVSSQLLNKVVGPMATNKTPMVHKQSEKGPIPEFEASLDSPTACSSALKSLSRKWKRAARDKIPFGKLSSPMKKQLTTQQGRKKSFRGHSLSPQTKVIDKGKQVTSTPPPHLQVPYSSTALSCSPGNRKRRKDHIREEEEIRDSKKAKSDSPVVREISFPAAEPVEQARRTS